MPEDDKKEPTQSDTIKERLLSNRRISISGELTENSIRAVAESLLSLECKNNEPITLIIDSCGGAVFPTQQLGDLIQSINSPVDGIAISDCASMAVDLLQMCRRRMLRPSARVLVHFIRHRPTLVCDDENRITEYLKTVADDMRHIAAARLNLYMRRTGLPAENIFAMFRHGETHSYFMTAQQALQMGLADEIVTDFKLIPKHAEKT